MDGKNGKRERIYDTVAVVDLVEERRGLIELPLILLA